MRVALCILPTPLKNTVNDYCAYTTDNQNLEFPSKGKYKHAAITAIIQLFKMDGTADKSILERFQTTTEMAWLIVNFYCPMASMGKHKYFILLGSSQVSNLATNN